MGKAPLTTHGFKDATLDNGQITAWWGTWPRANVGIATGAVSGVVVLDLDPAHGGADSLADLERQHEALPLTPRVLTGGGGTHFYCTHPGGTLASSAGTLGPGLDIRADGGYVVAPPSLHTSGRRYEWDAGAHPDDVSLAEIPGWLLELLRGERSNGTRPAERQGGGNPAGWIARALSGLRDGNRSDTFTRVMGRLTREGWTADEMIALLQPHADACGYPAEELAKQAKGMARYGPAAEASPRERLDPPWPAELDAAAFHGLAGKITRAIAAVTEAAPVAILANVLAAYGSLIGPGAHCLVGHDRHPARLFFVQVGATSKGRKRTGWGEPRELATRADPVWVERVREGGLSSGEGLIFQVRDPVFKRVRDKKTGDWNEELIDEGESDKRLFVLEEEFAAALAVMRREGSILSPIIRQGWDTGNLWPMVKNNPTRATGAHICIMGHITREELRARLDDTALLNGFANRFIWLAVRREQILPEGGGLAEDELARWCHELAQAVEFGRNVGEVRRDAEARELWREVYGPLSEGKPGLLGAATARAEAQVLRLSLVYALLDSSTLIRSDHLLAALALWRYAEESAAWTFGDAVGNPMADAILGALRAGGPLTRTAIRDLLGRNAVRGNVDAAMSQLAGLGRVRVERVREGGGRPTEFWHAT